MRFIYLLSIILLISTHAKSQSSLPSSTGKQPAIIKFYPNPAVTKITFDFHNGYVKNSSFQIFNFIGKKVFELPLVTSPKTTIELADFFRGVYIFQLKDKNGKIIESGRFQVSK